MTGIVKWFNVTKGYGFITVDETKQDVFVHYSAIRKQGHRALNEGDRVQFEIFPGGKGEQAKEVVLINQ
jgi:cold shock protein